ncbi:MAG: Lrp/AsnC family transcriptional regulator [Inquilinus sp.]|nr:Lrp/AsnC family transcriptional regulator [Inquilinus sp.]
MASKAEGPEAGLDAIDRRLLAAVERDARASYAALGRRVGLSAPAVAERLRRLEAAGIVIGYRARLDRARLGRGLTAFIRLKLASRDHAPIDALARDLPEILEAHQVTGEESYILKVAVASVADLDRLMLRLAPHAATTSQLVLSTPVEDKPVAMWLAAEGR